MELLLCRPSLLLSLVSFLSSPFLVLLPPVCAPLNRVNDRERASLDEAFLHSRSRPLTYPEQCLIMQIFANKNLQVSLVQFMRNGLRDRDVELGENKKRS